MTKKVLEYPKDKVNLKNIIIKQYSLQFFNTNDFMKARVLETQEVEFIIYSRSTSSHKTVTMIVRRVPYSDHFTNI